MRRLSNWSIAGIIVGALLLIGLGIALSIRSTADAAWKAMNERTHALIAEARARPAARPVLRGTAEPGNAWTDYKAAISQMTSIGLDRHLLYAYLTRGPNSDDAAVVKLVTAQRGALDLLRRGVRRAEASYPYEWERGSAFELPPLLRLQELGMLATAHARLLHQAGRTREAAEWLLDVAQFGGDIRRNGVVIADMIGLAVLFVALDELRALQAASPIAAADLHAIDRELAQLDRDWPDFAVSLRNEAMTAQAAMLAGGAGDSEGDPTFLESWRYGFSRKLMIADACVLFGRSMELFIGQESLPWPQRVKASEEMKREADGWRNPLLRGFSGWFAAYTSVHQRRAQLRLLRMAIRFKLDGTLPELQDPYGTQMKHAASGSPLKLWSVGRDGIDQGGTGDWSRNELGADIVLEIQR